MKLSCKILYTISCVSFSLWAMEEEKLSLCKTEQNNLSINNSSAHIQINQNHYYPLNSVYKTTYQTLRDYNPTDRQSIQNIFKIIDTTTKLQINGCDEIECGRFAYQQHIHQRDPMALHISLFFEKLAEHKAHMKKNDFTPPTLDELIKYTKIPLINVAIEKAAAFRLIIRNKIDPQTAALLDSHNKTTNGLSEYENLIKDIKTMLEMSTEDTKLIADLLYGPKL